MKKPKRVTATEALAASKRITIEPKGALPEHPSALTVLRHEEGDLRGQIDRNVALTAELRARLKVVCDLLVKCDPEYVRRNEDRWAHRLMFGIGA